MDALKALLTATMLVLAAPVVAVADVPPQQTTAVDQQLQELGVWTSSVQNITNGMVGVMQNTPQPPSDDMSNAERRAWAASARTWAQQSDTVFAGLLVQAQQLAPSPPDNAPIAPEFRAALEQSRLRLPDILNAANEISRSYPALADAFERRQRGAVRDLRIRGLDATQLTITLISQMNEGQALAMPAQNPQRYLLMSYVRSYHGFSALMRFKREVMVSGNPSRATESAASAEISAAAIRARDYIRQGLAAQQAVRAMTDAAPRATAEDRALIEFMTEMMATYDSSFVREQQMTAELDTIAALMLGSGDFAAREPEIDVHMERFGQMDVGRMEDASRRQQVMLRR